MIQVYLVGSYLLHLFHPLWWAKHRNLVLKSFRFYHFNLRLSQQNKKMLNDKYMFFTTTVKSSRPMAIIR